ncbi:carbohydrate kinase, thermoresistant glucokinase family (plasmid) [Ketogulonicigenium vulgare Y25]|uniref:Gluconokinase n=1 Tax=Ketogulonicigenium vulgare (strain WSH-001) TaxID=759362 RepID=F9YBT5_KETVW|nr:gluconokinase [Ketogulonicigenium vulgare]ADO44403.1 carbohydrate kinase, thermoresistant glucokinase family [Ketogulonicigenium vulgare Y25]AEM42837.1 thermoresistant gluconokinase-like protein [Ketogulonicigenium vulgare WSH-001]ALJ82734.1 gluconate kinase [Ketogulonicigenium vulgare]
MAEPQHFVVFGVAGAGKTTVAHQLADATGRIFADADDFHTPEAVQKMSSGIALTTEDRLPWLARIRDWMDMQAANGQRTSVACSALRRDYRDILRGKPGDVRFIFLSGTQDLIGSRLAARAHHYMPSSLLASQFQTLEPLFPDENGVTIDVSVPVTDIVDQLRRSDRLAG